MSERASRLIRHLPAKMVSAIRGISIAGPVIPIAVFVLSLGIYAAMTDNLIAKMLYPTGDEPYYLMMAQSMLEDHDVELTNDFASREYWSYYPGELYPRHESITVRPGLWSKHHLGVAALIAPGFALDAWRGAALTIALLAALLAANIYLLGYEVSGKWAVGLLTWLALAFTNPLASYAPLIFPAIPAALFTVYAFRQIRLRRVPSDRWRSVAAGLCIGALPWLNAQLIPVSAGLFAYALAMAGPAENAGVRFRERAGAWLRAWAGRGRDWWAFLAPIGALAAADAAYYYYLYESFLPNWQDHAGSSGLDGTVVGFFGSFLDQQWGLLVHAPLLLLALSGLVVLWRRDRPALGWLAVIGLPYLLLIINYKQWWGEWCPPARYLAPLVPLLALPMARAARALRWRPYLAVFFPLAAASYGIMAAFVYKPRLMYNHPVGQSTLLVWVAEQGGPDLTHLVPTYFIAEEVWPNLALTVVWTVAVLAIVWLGARGAAVDDTQ